MNNLNDEKIFFQMDDKSNEGTCGANYQNLSSSMNFLLVLSSIYIHLFIYLSIYLSVCLSIYFYTQPHLSILLLNKYISFFPLYFPSRFNFNFVSRHFLYSISLYKFYFSDRVHLVHHSLRRSHLYNIENYLTLGC